MFTTFLLSSSLFILPSHPLTVEEVVSIALEHNPETKGTWWNAKRAVHSRDKAKSAYFPTVDLDLGVTHGKEFEFINGPNRKFTETSGSLTLSWLLFDFGERSSGVKASIKALEAANWEHDFAVQKVMIETLRTCYSVLHDQEAVDAATVSRDDAKKMLQASRDLQEAGFSSMSDVFSSRAMVADKEIELSRYKANLDIDKGELAALMGKDAGTSFELAPLSQIKPPLIEDTQLLIKRAKSHRKDLLAKQANAEEADWLLEKATLHTFQSLRQKPQARLLITTTITPKVQIIASGSAFISLSLVALRASTTAKSPTLTHKRLEL